MLLVMLPTFSIDIEIQNLCVGIKRILVQSTGHNNILKRLESLIICVL